MEIDIRRRLKEASRVVIKLGTSVLLDERGYPSEEHLRRLVMQIAALYNEKREIIIVSSGAIGSGLKVLGISKRPKRLPELQMAASVGQSYLMSLYARLFGEHGIPIGQILLTHDDLRNRVRHLNARNSFSSLLKNGVVPIVNENDVVSVNEIRVGDNDVLASMVALLVGADALVLATTAEGFYVQEGSSKRIISHIERVSDAHLGHAQGKGSELSTGGMATKLKAASNLAKMGGIAAIVDGREPVNIVNVLNGRNVGTVIGSTQPSRRTSQRKQWIAFFNRAKGTIIVDDGAKSALENRRSLLPVGIVGVKGTFGIGSLVEIEDKRGKAVALGLCEFSSVDVDALKGRTPGTEVIHCDNIWIDV